MNRRKALLAALLSALPGVLGKAKAQEPSAQDDPHAGFQVSTGPIPDVGNVADTTYTFLNIEVNGSVKGKVIGLNLVIPDENILLLNLVVGDESFEITAKEAMAILKG